VAASHHARFVAGAGANEAQAEANKVRLMSPCVCITTFNMIAHKGKRSAYGEEVSGFVISNVRDAAADVCPCAMLF
jgi:hypothetical protein